MSEQENPFLSVDVPEARPNSFARFVLSPRYDPFWRAKEESWKRMGIRADRTVYVAMFVRSRGFCENCGVYWRSRGRLLAFDHDHESGAPRGLLCYRCNRALGRREILIATGRLTVYDRLQRAYLYRVSRPLEALPS